MTETERRITAHPELLELFRDVASTRMLTLDDVCGSRRHPRTVAGRHECWWHLMRMGWSSTEVGRLWGVDHSTVLRATKGWELDEEEGS